MLTTHAGGKPDLRMCAEVEATCQGIIKVATDLATSGKFMDWVDDGSRWSGIAGPGICPADGVSAPAGRLF